ncbi:MAG: NAD-dependent epimerase/dehydratase family protein [Cyanobacteria bacterium LVE1205-1]|jgi:dihydroflavonol-4-reductase|nr:NAD-dependent epimerase/dehydratase family protein [Cyanobacteria bacterium WB6_1B_304]
MSNQVFVTGATGFIGSNLVRLLLDCGHQVRVLVRPGSRLDNLENLAVEIIRGDLTDGDHLTNHLHGCEVLFHVAAHYSLWQSDRKRLFQDNVIGTRTILAAAKTAKVERTVYTSSVAAIGVRQSGIADETYQSPVDQLVGQYKKSKYWAEQEAVKAVQSGQNVVIVNPTTPIGPWDIKPTPTGEIILRFLRRQMPAYMDTGLNLVDVRDVAMGHILAWQRGQTGQRYILGHENLSLQQILQLLADLTGYPVPRYRLPTWVPFTAAWVDEYLLSPLGKKPSVPLDGVRMATQKMFYHSHKAVEEIGLPQTPIPIALKDAIDWFAEHGYLV